MSRTVYVANVLGDELIPEPIDAGFAVKPPDDEGHIYMDARFDVSDLTADQRDQLALEVSAQGDRSDGHPSVEVVEITFTGAPR